MNCTIPDHWTGDDALTFVAFLEQVIAAIWSLHGHAMAAQLSKAEDQTSFGAHACPPRLDPRPALLDPPSMDDASHGFDDDIPW